eukprot:TRINITY_DN1955_c0_g1_i1.p1 TRINITY_DN1955_c0_g1~~TRINITY_DN1955_c0_g1_i1.p1  ORF type:complete len:101 (+),score=8.57 TRINITY_DN1955_c0_g1_i1:139-441(+)
MLNKQPPNSFSRLRAMFQVGTEGLFKSAIPTREKTSERCRDFLTNCLEQEPEARATAPELLEHPFVNQPQLSEGIQQVLRGIFMYVLYLKRDNVSNSKTF